MANVNDALMRKKPTTGRSSSKRKRNGNAAFNEDVSRKPKRSAMASWLSPATSSRISKSTITPEPKAEISAKVHDKMKSPAKLQPATQSYIDVGQRSFGKHVTCPTCGLLYTVGEEEDEKEHHKFCTLKKRGVTFAKWKTERVLKSFSDTRARILEIRADDPISHVKKLLEVKEVLDDALGFVEEEVFLQRSHFVYIQDHQVVGCVNTERITEAFTLDKNALNLVAQTNSDEEGSVAADGAVTASATSKPAVIGICQLWVHPSFRRKSIATRLLNVVREKSIYGMHIAKNLVAFAQPTRNGLQFAIKYMEPCEVLIY